MSKPDSSHPALTPSLTERPAVAKVVGDAMQPVLSAARLFGQQRELLIEHAGVFYRLRITQNNKLILTK